MTTGDGRTARWVLLLMKPAGVFGREPYPTMATVDGTREEAVQRFGEFVRLYRPSHPSHPVRMRRFRTDDGWMVIGDGLSGSIFAYHFLITELEWDSGPISY
jgi:hypothetical protein